MRFPTRGKSRPTLSLPTPIRVEVLERRQLLSASVIATLDTMASPVAALTVTASAGKKVSGELGTWTTPTGVPKPGSETTAIAIVTWGDGRTSRAKFVDDGSGVVQIVGSHVWAKPGTFQMTVKVEEYRKEHPHILTAIGQGSSSILVAPKLGAFSIKGTLSGSYTFGIPNLGARNYGFTGTGTADTPGAVSVSGSIDTPGFRNTGQFMLTTATGTVTFNVTGYTQSVDSPLPRKMTYTVTGGTGAYAGVKGKGTITIALDDTTATFVIVVH